MWDVYIYIYIYVICVYIYIIYTYIINHVYRCCYILILCIHTATIHRHTHTHPHPKTYRFRATCADADLSWVCCPHTAGCGRLSPQRAWIFEPVGWWQEELRKLWFSFQICMYVCMYVCMHACMHACMHVCMYVCMYICMYVCLGLKKNHDAWWWLNLWTHSRTKTRPCTTTLSTATVRWLSGCMIVYDLAWSYFFNILQLICTNYWICFGSHVQARFKPVSSLESRCTQAVSSDTTLPSRWQSAQRPAGRPADIIKLCSKSSDSHDIESATSIKSMLFKETLY